MLKITKVLPQPNHILTVYLDNGCAVMLDMSAKLHTARYAGLADNALFMKATTDGNFVRWKPTLEMSVSDVLDVAGCARDRYACQLL